ncbi:MAG: L-threonine 3-dehydrogenase [Syntrophomonadaceae bacterium]|nr:L-threonine 3-dehydrogenase [Bacillota bacterium]MBT9146977.1 L-threonine 3-dehydrogenase [Bacillota bacterium]
MKTQAVIFPEPNKFELTELELEEPGPKDIQVKTLVSAISPGTERWVLRGKHMGSQFPCVPGYHRIGIVEECGKETANFKVGDIVYGSAGRWKGNIISMWGAHVGFSVGDWTGYRFVASSTLNRLELETLSFAIVAGVANRGIRFCNVGITQKILIIGSGFIGICAAQLAAGRGAHPVLLEQDTERIAFAKNLISDVLCTDDKNLETELQKLAPDGFDILYDTVGHAETTDRMVQKMKRQGTLLLQAQYFDRERCALNLDQIKIRELTVKTTCGTDDQDWLETTHNIRTRHLKIAPLITHRFEANEALKGYQLLHTGKPLNMGIVFRWDERVKD